MQRALVLLVGIGITGALIWRARRAGMSVEDVGSSVFLGCALAIGLSALLAFGVCLVGITTSSRR